MGEVEYSMAYGAWRMMEDGGGWGMESSIVAETRKFFSRNEMARGSLRIMRIVVISSDWLASP